MGVTGALREDRWTDNASGNKRSNVIVIARNVEFLPGNRGDGIASAAATPEHDPADDETDEPF